MMLGDVIAVKTGFFRRLQQDHPLVIGPGQRLGPQIDVVENSEFHTILVIAQIILGNPRIFAKLNLSN